MNEYRENPDTCAALRRPILDSLTSSGLTEDCPFDEGTEGLTEANVEEIPQPQFDAYVSRLYAYLQVQR